MKTITVTDKDYETLMELSKELQTQTNNAQAFPYYWNPASYKQEVNIHGEGAEIEVSYDCDTYTLEEFAESYEKFYNEFIDDFNLYGDKPYALGIYHKDLENAWMDYISNYIDEATTWTLDWEHKEEHNPTLFLKDAESYVKNNAHHLGKDPHTYSRTIQRMPRMEMLVECLLRINNSIPEAESNHEALRCKKKGEEHLDSN